MKRRKYVFIWIEGLEPKSGEKIRSFREDGSINYTTKMMDAMRIPHKSIETMRSKLQNLHIADWAITFVNTSYAPKGTIFKP